MRTATTGLILLTLSIIGRPVATQESPTKPSLEHHTFILFEAILLFRMNEERFGGQFENEPNWLATWELGPMFALGERSSLGVTLFGGADDDGSRYGIRPRYRRRLGSKTALDVGVGSILGGGGGFGHQQFPSFTGSVTVSHGNWLGATLQVDAIRIKAREQYRGYDHATGRSVIAILPSDIDIGVYAGIRFGGLPGLLMSAAEFVLVAIAASTI